MRLRAVDRTLTVMRGPTMSLDASPRSRASSRSGRQFATRLALTPLQNASGGKKRLGRITKTGVVIE